MLKLQIKIEKLIRLENKMHEVKVKTHVYIESRWICPCCGESHVVDNLVYDAKCEQCGQYVTFEV